jgi:hypothetical protein
VYSDGEAFPERGIADAGHFDCDCVALWVLFGVEVGSVVVLSTCYCGLDVLVVVLLVACNVWCGD